MSIQGLYPFSGNHAIQSAVFAVEWAEPLLLADLEKVRSAAEPLKNEFPASQDQQMLVVNMTPGSRSAAQQSELGGFVLSRNSTFLGGPNRTIVLNRESIQIHVSDYSRWEKVKSEVASYLRVLIPAIERPFTELGLQYQDVFNWRAEPEAMPIKDIFRQNSKYLVGNVFSLKNLWHSHHGYFEDFEIPCKFRRLDNINVARVASPIGHAVQVVTSHRAHFSDPLWDKMEKDDSSCFEILDGMHSKNKEILRELLSDDVQNMIQLNKKEVINGV